ncbi:adenosine kinase [Tulasnella sp. JGI-2019a]|nr:adenosine kinase [Tulasnella sp. JGI-2019a]KAG8993548.1 adenosine kinase [Tulasnella sp. JGI-2019a]KAG9021959.1 adenosine kinase [Tulasnella sp. JGI-2019a]
MATSTPKFPLFCMGNPLLDIQVKSEEILKKYKLKANDAILAGEEQQPIYEEIVKNHQVTYVAGGAAQNAARAAAYVLPENSVVYAGCVGDDDLADQLRAANKREGVESAYLVAKGVKTGACAVVLTGHDRSLVTTLRAAEKFDKAHLSSPEVAPLIANAKVFYVGGFFLTHGVESALIVAQEAAKSSKIFGLNLSAPFIAQFFKVQLEKVIPYTDILFGNESEAAAWAEASGLPNTTDLGAIALSLAKLPKANAARPRTVVITAGADATHVATSDSDKAKVYKVDRLPDDKIVDTNGAGDAFAGGFMGAIVLGKTVDEAVEVGHKLGAMCVGQVGPQLKWPKENVL